MHATNLYEAETYDKLVSQYSDNTDYPIFDSDVKYVRQVIGKKKIELDIYDFVESVNERIAADFEATSSDIEHENSFRQPY